MKKLLYIIPAMVFVACSTDITEELQPEIPVNGGEMTSVEAVIDGQTIVDTRNSLVDKDGARFILWSEV